MKANQFLAITARHARKYVWATLIIIALGGFSLGQTISGTLSSTSTTTTSSGTCSIRTTNTSWTFTDNLNVAHNFPDPTITTFLMGCSGACAGRTKTSCVTQCGCPPSGSTTLQEWSDDNRYFINATGGTGSITAEKAYVNPRFLVVGVTYAPPGPSGNTFVSYGNSTFVGSTESISSSFNDQITTSLTLTQGFNIPLGKHAKISNTVTTTASQSDTDMVTNKQTFTTSIQATGGETTFGTGDYFAPVNNDYDLIWVWLNPIAIFTFNAGNPVPVWNGYGADSSDQNGMDIVPIALGYLNGDFGPIPPDIQGSINRAWAATQVFLAGEGPALTSADLAEIASADPFSVSTYGSTEIGSIPPSPSTPDNRFTLSLCNGNNSFSYLQADPSTTPNIFTCTISYTNLSTFAQGIKRSHSQTFSIDDAFSGLAFFFDFGAELKTSQTLTWETEAQTSITTSQTSTANLSVQGPPCNNAMPGVGPCIPVYDANGDQPTQFMVYQDNMFGTFMFAPVHFYP